MNRTTADSKGFDIICMSFGKEPEKELEVVEAREKDSFLLETMETKAAKCTLDDMKFSKQQIKTLMENRAARKTAKTAVKVVSQR